MTKDPHGKSCKICDRPFTIFRWRPGAKARYKATQVCQTCAKMKNVCQVCIFDLTYGRRARVHALLTYRDRPPFCRVMLIKAPPSHPHSNTFTTQGCRCRCATSCWRRRAAPLASRP